MNDNKRFWSRWSGIYDKFMSGNKPLYDEIATRMKRHLNRQMNVLELACGTGLLSKQIAYCVDHLEATDFSAEMIEEARKKGSSSRLHYSVQDATNLPYETESFDAVVISNALHIMPSPEKAMHEIFRVLKKDGVLFAPTFVHGEGSGYRIRTKIMELGGFKTYHKWNAQEFVEYISHQGFEITDTATMGSSITPLCYLEARKIGK